MTSAGAARAGAPRGRRRARCRRSTARRWAARRAGRGARRPRTGRAGRPASPRRGHDRLGHLLRRPHGVLGAGEQQQGRRPLGRQLPVGAVGEARGVSGAQPQERGRWRARSRPMRQALCTSWPISSPLRTARHGTGLPLVRPGRGVRDLPSPPIACQDTLLGLTSTRPRQGSDGSVTAAASTPRRRARPPSPRPGCRRPPGWSASRRTAPAKRSSGTDAIAAAASSSLIQHAASAANPRAASSLGEADLGGEPALRAAEAGDGGPAPRRARARRQHQQALEARRTDGDRHPLRAGRTRDALDRAPDRGVGRPAALDVTDLDLHRHPPRRRRRHEELRRDVGLDEAHRGDRGVVGGVRPVAAVGAVAARSSTPSRAR